MSNQPRCTWFDVLYYSTKPNGERTLSHKYNEPWKKTELHCPRCGAVEVWVRCDGGDYYVGETYICVGCVAKFYLPDGIQNVSTEQDQQRLERLVFCGGLPVVKK